MQHSSNDKKLNCAVSISKYAIYVKVGVTDEERAYPQKIFIDINLKYPALPNGCISDDIGDVICYDSICQLIAKSVEGKEFKLIEYLSFYVFNLLKKTCREHLLHVRVVKAPSIVNLEGNAIFEIYE
jgi:dihydroneopterin aldolase